jgi:hypothetical protein
MYSSLDETYKKYFKQLENEKDIDKLNIILNILADLNRLLDEA